MALTMRSAPFPSTTRMVLNREPLSQRWLANEPSDGMIQGCLRDGMRSEKIKDSPVSGEAGGDHAGLNGSSYFHRLSLTLC